MSTPKNLESYFYARAVEGGKIEYGVRKLGEVKARATIPGRLAAMIAGIALKVARESHQQTGKAEPSSPDEIVTAFIVPTTIGVGLDPSPGHEGQIAVFAGFSGPEIALSIDKATAKNLAEQLLAMTAEGAQN